MDPLPDLDGGLLLHHVDVLGPLLKRVDELLHDAAPVGVLLEVDTILHLLLSSGDKLQDEGGGGKLVTLLGDHIGHL